MASPFPGMDPYLENTDFWQGFHNSFMAFMQEDLQSRLPENYVATLEVRIYLDPDPISERRREQRIPDLEVIRTGPAQASTAAVLERPRGQVLDLNPVEAREAYVSIRDLPSGNVVTSVELLSPSNKRSGTGRDEYLGKQWHMFDAGANLVELDLLRGGLNTLLVSAERLARLAPFHYLAGIYRPANPLKYEAFTWSVRDPLPEISLPLHSSDGEVPLDLAKPFQRAFNAGAFHKLLNYRGEPSPSLAPDDAAWADQLLREAGLRGEGA